MEAFKLTKAGQKYEKRINLPENVYINKVDLKYLWHCECPNQNRNSSDAVNAVP